MSDTKTTDIKIRGRDLKISESDVFSSLPFFSRVRAFFFGGVFGIGDPDVRVTDSVLPRVAVVYVPPLWKRIYYKHFFKSTSSSREPPAI